MVVDDHPMWCDAIARDLTEAGYDVVASAADGAQALRIAGATRPDVVVLDLQLPDTSFSMTGKVHVTITMLVSERKVLTCNIRPLAYGIQPQISGNTVSFDLDRPRYLVLFFNDEPAFNNTGLMLFAEPPEKNPPRLGDPNVVNIRDYQVDSTGKTVETAKINRAIGEVSARPGGGVLFFPAGVYLTGTVSMKSN